MEVLMGKTSINGPFSMAMLNNQMVYDHDIINHHPIVLLKHLIYKDL